MIINMKNWEIKQVNFIGAFLNNNLTDVNIYLKILKRFSKWVKFCSFITVKTLIEIRYSLTRI